MSLANAVLGTRFEMLEYAPRKIGIKLAIAKRGLDVCRRT